VLLSAFWDKPDDVQILRERWIIQDQEWQMHIGNFIRKVAYGKKDVPITDDLFPTVGQILRSQSYSMDVHWLRIYYGNMDDKKQQIVEVRLDNETWPSAEDMIRRVSWPILDYFYSCRLFLIMQPCT